MYSLKLALRNLTRQRSVTIINVIGLSLSLTVCLLIALLVQYEYSFENHNPDANNIYRLLQTADGKSVPVHPIAMFDPLTNAIPDLNKGVMVQYQSEKFLVVNNEHVVIENLIFTTNEFITFFKIDMIEGGNEPLPDASSAIISRSLAEMLFPGISALGKTLRFENRYDFHVKGVFEDAPVTANNRPSLILNIHAKETLDSFEYTSMNNQSTNIYYLLPDNTNLEEIEEKILKQASISYGFDSDDVVTHFAETHFNLQSLKDIHLNSSHTTYDILKRSDAKMVHLFILVAVLLLLVAMLNYINLSITLRYKRNFHTGIQKIMGAERKNIFGYLLAETSLLVIFSLVIAVFLTTATLPQLNMLMDTEITFTLSNPMFWGATVGIIIINILIPALFQLYNQMKVNPSTTIRSKDQLNSKKGSIPWAECFTIAQIAISIGLIIGVTAINKQFELLLNDKLGFDKSNLVSITNPHSENSTARFKLYKHELESLPIVSGITGTWDAPGHPFSNGTILQYTSGNSIIKEFCMQAPTDGDFFNVMRTNFILGEPYSGTDSTKAVINEQYWQNMNVENPVGMKVTNLYNGKLYEISGVIEDIQNHSLQNESRSAFYYMLPNLGTFLVRLKPGDLQKSIGELRKVWNSIEPNYPFRFSFVDDDLQANYVHEIRTRKLLTIMSFLSIFISMLGLYGLSLQIIQRRTKEIGIRKVNGASISEILSMLNKQFVYWILAAFIIAVPLTYYAMTKWLEAFVYKAELSWWIFALGGVITFLVALLTVSWQSWRSATRNPVEAISN